MDMNYRAELVGVLGDPVDGNPTGVMEEAGIEHAGLNYRYITKATNIELVRGISSCFICILNSIHWLIFKMRVIEVLMPYWHLFGNEHFSQLQRNCFSSIL